ncbi:hypothetical protein QYE88_42400, partial [Enterobacter hormaechei subsp. steigerwaltii]|nr:hypothetical protein [Enterobacter hormaechei subsp. steigerwaltii]
AYSNGVFQTPQLFAFAKGAGVFAEAGPEAIMPLTRAPDGSLGVRAVGAVVAGVAALPGGAALTGPTGDGAVFARWRCAYRAYICSICRPGKRSATRRRMRDQSGHFN